ncbi:MAG: hypothetical protein JWP97_3407 [Labilithrix sp.]|nr:hypothetical protein [Labilithrix sp.]
MKTALVTGVLLWAACSACSPAPHEFQSRHPSGAGACTSDEQCIGGQCMVPPGATQGQCSAGSQPAVPPHSQSPGRRPGRGQDGGSPQGPAIQPGPNDIQL